MPLPFTAIFLNIFNFGSGIIGNLVASKIWDKFNKDLEGVIFNFIKEQNQKFKEKFPDATIELNEKEMRPFLTRRFSKLTADKLEEPLNQEQLAQSERNPRAHPRRAR